MSSSFLLQSFRGFGEREWSGVFDADCRCGIDSLTCCNIWRCRSEILRLCPREARNSEKCVMDRDDDDDLALPIYSVVHS